VSFTTPIDPFMPSETNCNIYTILRALSFDLIRNSFNFFYKTSIKNAIHHFASTTTKQSSIFIMMNLLLERQVVHMGVGSGGQGGPRPLDF